MRTITLAEHAGFCFGVGAAVRKALDSLAEKKTNEETLYCLGELIHNKVAIEEFRQKGLVTIHSLSDVEDGASVFDTCARRTA